MRRAAARIARGALSGLFFVAYGLFAIPFALLLPIPVWPKKAVRAVLRALFRLFVFLARVTGQCLWRWLRYRHLYEE